MTPEEIRLVAELKRRIGDNDRTDEDLLALLAVYGLDVNRAAAEIWSEKTAQYAELIDISEGSSVRKLSQLHNQAAAMVKRFSELATPATPGIDGAAYTAPITRAGA